MTTASGKPSPRGRKAPAKTSAARGKPRGATGSPRRAAHEVRIIGGQWKRSKLAVADKPGLRPTPDRVRETLFNWLTSADGDWSGWQVVDAFAGTGALGFEAASRGAGRVTLIEQDAGLVAQLSASKARLDADAVNVLRGDGLVALGRWGAGTANLVLLDPPFDVPWYGQAIAAAQKALAVGGWLYLEAPRAYDAEEIAALGLQPYRYLKAGAVHAHLLQRIAPQP
ncbi:16S rRNA (guanine(966)-N(2))-methyltransferase RsmD [Comamonas sp. BIGb0124]|uniref:RsmD family RNA methyltransferase n=1 Tax=Comamonas sp. BIGb0124 TaxID=2485130 RepID=UPI000F49256E|nr:RsmD family RNA methyltransferase [Comamonas sp. BIGb0124]ROR22883.1 16S rRNA (guanine(966)-N(2))-methyltransferase RsmD [Comamonas sp. BIGb0124]